MATLQPTYIYGIHRPSKVKLSANPALPPDCSKAIKKKNKPQKPENKNPQGEWGERIFEICQKYKLSGQFAMSPKEY